MPSQRQARKKDKKIFGVCCKISLLDSFDPSRRQRLAQGQPEVSNAPRSPSTTAEPFFIFEWKKNLHVDKFVTILRKEKDRHVVRLRSGLCLNQRQGVINLF